MIQKLQLFRLNDESAFALVTLLWLAAISFFSSTVIAGIILSRYRALEGSRRSLEQALELTEVIEKVERSTDLIPKTWDTKKDTIYWVGEPARRFRVSCRRWGLWAIVEVFNGNSDEPIARRVVAGSRIPAPGVVAYIRTNRLPLVIAHEATIHGILAVADSIMVRPWRGRLFSRPKPGFTRNVATFKPYDAWEGLSEQTDRWADDPDSAQDDTVILVGPATLSRPPPEEIITIIVLGDLEIMGDWGRHPMCLCAKGNIRLSEGSCFVGQLLAEGKIVIDGAHLMWPSLVATSRGAISGSPAVSLHGGTLLEGAIVAAPNKMTTLSSLQGNATHALIEPAAKLVGAAFVTGALQMNGTIEGWVEVDETLERIETATYHNWILNGTWMPLSRRQKYPLFPIGLSHGSYISAVLGGLR